jgi:hypothetical protein
MFTIIAIFTDAVNIMVSVHYLSGFGSCLCLNSEDETSNSLKLGIKDGSSWLPEAHPWVSGQALSVRYIYGEERMAVRLLDP